MGAEIFQAISATKATIDGLKSLSQYAEEVKDITKRGEFMNIIGDLKIQLGETQIRVSDYIRENGELKEQVATLQKKIETLENPDSKLIIKNGLYYTSEDDGPFCTGCYDSDRKTIRLSEMPLALKRLGKFECPKCKSKYGQKKLTASDAANCF
jgi:hypothetical protein